MRQSVIQSTKSTRPSTQELDRQAASVSGLLLASRSIECVRWCDLCKLLGDLFFHFKFEPPSLNHRCSRKSIRVLPFYIRTNFGFSSRAGTTTAIDNNPRFA